MKQIAKFDDKNSLIELYNICFPGEEDYCSKFFDIVWKPEKTLIYRVDGQIVSMLQMFEFVLTHGRRDYTAYYIFGAATHPDYRGQSIMRELISESELMNSDKDFAILIAAGESLKSFYGKLGFSDCFSYDKQVIKAEKRDIKYNVTEFSEIKYSDAADCLKKMNIIYHANTGSDVVCRRTESFLFDELYCREAVVFYTEDSYAVAEISDNEITFVECIGSQAHTVAESVIYDNNKDYADAYFPGDSYSLGMCKKISCDDDIKGYLNLLFN